FEEVLHDEASHAHHFPLSCYALEYRCPWRESRTRDTSSDRRPRTRRRMHAVVGRPYVSRNSSLNNGRPATALWNAYTVKARTIAIANMVLPAYQVEKSGVSGKPSRRAATMEP